MLIAPLCHACDIKTHLLFAAFYVSFSCLLLFVAFNKEPIRIPSATTVGSDDFEDDASSLLVTKLMQTGSNSDATTRNPGGRSVVSGRTAAAAAAVRNGDMNSTLTLTDGAAVNSNNGIVDVSPERRTADNLHQLSLYVLVLSVALVCLLSKLSR